MEEDKNNQLLKPVEAAIQTETLPAEAISKIDLGNFEPQKAAMLQALEKRFGIVTYAAKDAGISRSVHYKWLENDEDYRNAVNTIGEVVLDLAEMRVFNYIFECDASMLRFFMLTKGKKRGYTFKLDGKDAAPMPVVKIVTRDEEQAAMVRKMMDNGKNEKTTHP